MDLDILKAVKFWDIIEMAREKDSVSEQKEFLISYLNSWGSYFTLLFDLALRQRIRDLFLKHTFEIVKLINLIASVEDLLDFCCFVILQGQKIYEEFILEPDSIMDSISKLESPRYFSEYNIVRLTDEAFEKAVNPDAYQEWKLLYPSTIGEIILPISDPDYPEPNFSDEYFTYLEEKYKKLAIILKR